MRAYCGEGGAGKGANAAWAALFAMYRSGGGRSSLSSSGRSRESSSGSRPARPGASARGRSPRRSRSPSPRGRRHRSPSPRRTGRARSPSGANRSRRGSEQRDGSLSRLQRLSPGRRSRSPGRHSRNRRSPSRHSESSVEQSLQITVGNDHYGIDTPERRRLSERLGSPVDSLSDVERDDLAEGPIFSRGLSRPQSLERYSSREDSLPSPFSMRHDDDYCSRDVFLHQSDYRMNYDHLQDISREPNRDDELLRKSLYQSEERGRDAKRPRYDREDRLLVVNMEHPNFLSGTRNYRKRSLSRSPSPTYLDEDFRELESARRKREEEELSRNSSRDLPGSDYVIPGLTNPVQSSEPCYFYRPDEAPAMPKKSILKKRVDDSSVQREVFSNSSASVKELPLHSLPPPLPQRSSIAPFSSEVENFLKRFNKNAVAESANKDSQASEHDWRPLSGLQQNTFPSEQNFGSFLRQKDYQESAAGSGDRHGDFLLPHERASQDGSGFSRILGMMADPTSAQEKKRRSFPDIEDEEKFLYGDDEDGANINSPSTEKLTMSGKEPINQKPTSLSSPTESVKPDTSEESRPEYEKIHDLLKTIGLDIGVAEIGKLAARTQERLHGKKPSRSPDRRSVVLHKPDSREMHHSRSSTRSPESNQKCSLSPSGSFPLSKELSSVSELEHSKCKTLGHDNSARTPERSVPPVSLIPSAPPSLPNLPPTPTPVSQYSVSRFSPFTPTQLPQNYPVPPMAPPGYDAYGHYMAYTASRWPMYAPPQQSDPAIPDVHGLAALTVPPNPSRPNLRVIETVSTGKMTPEIKRDESVLVQIPTTHTYSKLHPHFCQSSLRSTTERMSDEKNRASQKQKVIEEREKLKVEQEARQKKLHYLKTELDRLSKQQGEMLRKKRREKDGHKDPLLVEVNRLQENIMKEIAQLQIEIETAEKKQSELDKVAQILGINIFEKSRKSSAESKDSTEKNKSENTKSQEKTSSSNKESRPANDRPKCRSPKLTESCLQPSKQHLQMGNIYDYYDTGNHWCKDCNTICGTMFDFFTHMHNKKHRQTLDPYNRPWASKTQTETKQDPMKRIDKIPLPARGSEFLIPVTGYYCQLCHEFFGDQISAEQHVKSHPHNEKYKKYVDENPLYEERRNLDRQAGLSVIQETERRLKRKQCEKEKEDRDEKNAKVARKEESKPTKELELEDSNENDFSSKKKEDPNVQKFGIKLKLKKDDKEVDKKEEKKEESQKESKQSSFGKFSWKKNEKEDKNHGKDVASPKEDSIEDGKDKESKSQSGKSNSKPIAIKLSGKTVIPHTSPWTPVVSTSSQAKIRPNLPVPVMVLRKSATTTVSKPAPLNTFLSIKSSGATTKPLPVVKEGNPELVLPPDIISKAFGGEVVVLKGSQENVKVPEQTDTQVQEAESVTKAVEHVKASMEKVQEQAMLVAKAQAKARELAVIAKEQELARLSKMHEQSHIFERPHRRPPLLPLPPRPPLSLLQPRPSPLLFPSAPLPPKQTPIILADDMAPGVSEDDKYILAMPVCPPPLPPPTTCKDNVKKMEKKNTCLAAGNAKDLYDIFYNNSGRSPADKPSSSVASDKGKLSPDEKERSTDMITDSKANIHSSIQKIQQNVDNSSGVNKIPESEEAPESEVVKAEVVSAVSEENSENETSVKRELKKISSDSQNTAKNKDAETSDDFQNSSVSLQNELEIKTTASAELSKKSSELRRAESTIQILNSSVISSDEVSKKHAELESVESDEQLSEEKALPLQVESKKPTGFKTSEFTMPMPESTPPLEEGSKNASELQTAEFVSPDYQLATLSSEEKALSLQYVSKKPVEFETMELTMAFSESSTPLVEEASKNASEHQITVLICPDNELVMLSSEDKALPLQNVSKKSIELETAEFTTVLPKSNTPPLLEEMSKNSSEHPTAQFMAFDDKVTTPLSEEKAFLLQDVSRKSPQFETAVLAMTLPERNVPPLGTFSKNASELQTAEFKFAESKELPTQLSEDSVPPVEYVSEKPSEFEKTEIATQLPESSSAHLEVSKNQSQLDTIAIKTLDNKELATPLPENNTDYNKDTLEVVDVGMTSSEDINQKLQDQQKMEVPYEIESDLGRETSVSILGERDVERECVQLAGCQSEDSHGDPRSQVLEMQSETHKEEGPVLTEGNQMNDNSELAVSEVCVQNQLAGEPIDQSSKIREENLQVAETKQTSSKDSPVDLKPGNVGFGRLESIFSEKSPQASVMQNMDAELKTLIKGESDSSYTNNKEEGLLTDLQQKVGEDFDVVHVLESREMIVEYPVNITTRSTQEQHEEINQQSLSCETKDLQVQGTEDLGGLSSSNDVEHHSGVELTFSKDGTQGSSKSTVELSGEGDSIEKENVIRVQPVTVQEPLDVLSTEFSVGHLGEEALSFTGMNTEVLNTSAGGDFDLHASYSELDFDQSATLTVNLNVENERDSPKSDKIKPTDPSRLESQPELETVAFSLSDIDVDHEHLGILPSEILNEDSVESPKLETIAPICLESSKTIELGINQPVVQTKVIDFAALNSGDQEDKFGSLVSDVADPHMVSCAPNEGSAEADMPLLKMQCLPPVSEALLKTDSKVGISETPSLICGDKSLQSQAAECMELIPNPSKTSLEAGGSGDGELYIGKNEMQMHARDSAKMEEAGSNDGTHEASSQLATEVSESSAEDLLL